MFPAPAVSVPRAERSGAARLSKAVWGFFLHGWGGDAAAREPERQIYCNAESFPNTTKWQLVGLKCGTTMEGPDSPSATWLFSI